MTHIVNGGEKSVDEYEASWIYEVSGMSAIVPEGSELERVNKRVYACAWHRKL